MPVRPISVASMETAEFGRTLRPFRVSSPDVCFPSGPFDLLASEQLFEGPGGLAEQLGAAEARVRSRGGQVWFEGKVAVEARVAQRGDGRGDLPVSLTRGNDPARAGERVLDVYVLDVGSQRLVPLLYGRPTPHCTKLAGSHAARRAGESILDEYVLAAAGDVTVDPLLVLVQERDANFRLVRKHAHTLEDLLPVSAWLPPLRDEEREDTDVRSCHDVGGAQGTPETIQVRSERVGYGYFAYRGAYRRMP